MDGSHGKYSPLKLNKDEKKNNLNKHQSSSGTELVIKIFS